MTLGEQEQWQLEGSAPGLYERYLVPAMTSKWATDLVEHTALRPGERVLDVACGTGVVARAAAELVGAGGHVSAVDINPGMLAVARTLPIGGGARIEWHEASALALPFAASTFDLVLCQLGLQFFPDRVTALREMRRVLVRGGRLGLSVFGPIEHNPATHALAEGLDRHLGRAASTAKRTEHELADSARLSRLVSAAGFEQIAVSTATKLVHFPSAGDYVKAQATATPLASLFENYDAHRRNELFARLVADVGSALAAYVSDDGLTFPQEVHTVLARR